MNHQHRLHSIVKFFHQLGIASIGFMLGIWSQPALADLVVTTYVTKTQNERAESRWTLTEWLRIKERMQMMDLWRSLMSDPKSVRFQPEISLTYGISRGQLKQESPDGTKESDSDVSGAQGKAQLWITNLISSTIGIRTLNVDLGIEGFRRQTSGDITALNYTSNDPAQEMTEGTTRLPKGSWQTSYYTGNLRIFGKNIQDSSLVLKWGEFQKKYSLIDRDPIGNTLSFPDTNTRGAVAGAELQLYLFKWLGAEGQYLRYGRAGELFKSQAWGGSYTEYYGFVEVSLFRLIFGAYQEVWNHAKASGERHRQTEMGQMAGVKIQF